MNRSISSFLSNRNDQNSMSNSSGVENQESIKTLSRNFDDDYYGRSSSELFSRYIKESAGVEVEIESNDDDIDNVVKELDDVLKDEELNNNEELSQTDDTDNTNTDIDVNDDSSMDIDIDLDDNNDIDIDDGTNLPDIDINDGEVDNTQVEDNNNDQVESVDNIDTNTEVGNVDLDSTPDVNTNDTTIDTSSTDNDDLADFGTHGGDDLPNNEYDPKEVEQLMRFVADEAKALSDYVEAAKTTHVPILQRLYPDIADEERFHLEQLLYAEAEITGKKYEPRDPDIRKEYEELLALGMDEESAMTTAVDKFNIRGSASIKIADGDANVQQDLKEIQETSHQLEQAILYADTLALVFESGDNVLIDKVSNLYDAESFIVQEDVSVSVNNVYTKKLSPIKAILSVFSLIAKLAHQLGVAIRKIIERNNHRIVNLAEWVKKHGIGALFASGVSFYLWNDKKNEMDIDPILYYANNCFWLTQEVIRVADLSRSPISSKIVHRERLFYPRLQQYAMKAAPMNCFRNISNLDVIKSKVVVTQNNASRLTEYFFSRTDYDDEIDQLLKRGGINMEAIPAQGYPFAANANFFTLIGASNSIIDSFSEIAKNIAGELEGLQNVDRSIYYKNPKMYNNCVEYMSAVSKGLHKIVNILSSDFQTLISLDSIIKNS